MSGGVIRRALAIAALAIAGTVAPTTAAHAASSRAVIVIGSSTYTISFSGSISGLQALQMVASVETVGFGFGQAVCKINGVGNPATTNNCLVGPNGEYWAYYRAGPGATGWEYSSRGASTTSVTDGSVEGWRYGTGGPPPFHSFCSVAGCGPPPPPVTTVPPVAPTGGSGGGPNGGKASTSTSTLPNGAAAPTGTEVTTTSTSTPRANEPDEQANGSPPGGRPEIHADDDGDGSPVGVAIAGGVVVALGGAGVWLRRRRITP